MILNGSEIPRLTEAGPYAFREVRLKTDILETNADTLHYATYMEYHYDQVGRKLNCDSRLHILALAISFKETFPKPLNFHCNVSVK